MTKKLPLRTLIDVAHPAHVHFYKNLASELVARNVPVLFVSRAKGATNALLANMGIAHRSFGQPHGSTFGQAAELAARVFFLTSEARAFNANLILTRNPAGALASRFLKNTVSVFDTDDGRAAGLHYHLGAAAANVVTAPSCLEDTGKRPARTYPGFKALAYLHPRRFQPNPRIRDVLGVGSRPFALLRLVSLTASHDRRAVGISPGLLEELLAQVTTAMDVFVSTERNREPPVGTQPLPTSPSELHSVVAAADFYLGDSQTMAIEAALLGTPVLHLSSWSGKLDCLRFLQESEMIASFHPQQREAISAHLNSVLENLEVAKRLQRSRAARFSSPEYDVTQWYVRLIEEVSGGYRV